MLWAGEQPHDGSICGARRDRSSSRWIFLRGLASVKRGGPMLWLIVAVAAGLSIPPVTMIVNELNHPVPEINPLFIGGVALLWLVVVWAPVAICIWVPRNFVRVPILVLMLVPYVVWIQRLGEQGFFWSLIRPDMV